MVTPVPHSTATLSGVRAEIGHESVEQRPVDVGRRRGPFDRESGNRGTQRGELACVAVLSQLALVGTALQQRVRQCAEHGDVRAGSNR